MNVALWKHRFLFDDDLQLRSAEQRSVPHLDNTDFFGGGGGHVERSNPLNSVFKRVSS